MTVCGSKEGAVSSELRAQNECPEAQKGRVELQKELGEGGLRPLMEALSQSASLVELEITGSLQDAGAKGLVKPRVFGEKALHSTLRSTTGSRP